MAKYGFPYMGSKADIADELVALLPSGNRFVDLFGGGGAMTHCAVLSKKWRFNLYNEFNPLCADLMLRAVRGDFNPDKFKPEFISRAKFLELKDKDGYVKYIWSFGNNGKGYLFGKVEEFKRNAHNFLIFRDADGLRYLQEHYKNSYWWHIERIQTRRDYVNTILKIEAIKVCVDYGDKQVYNKFKGLSYEEFRKLSNRAIVDAINEFCPDIPKKKYKNGNNKLSELKQLEQLQRLEQLQQLEQLEQLQRLQRLEQLERLQQLEQLERLEQLQQLERLVITQCSYEDYVYQDGDVVYCDPPYEQTAKYVDDFGHQKFYDWVASRPYQVFFSSYEISDKRFYRVWEKRRCAKLSSKTNQSERVEVLYSNKPYNTELQYNLF